ncbi:MAG: serine hydrolase domain-containing protein [Propionibacteriaceae bacterium]|nr:serine hydrolase domain-containing protein [Propionibacteriaceae bacterium]
MSTHEAAQAYLDRIVADGIVGAVGVVEDAEGTVCLAAGRMSVDGPPMPTDAIMRIQSMTKAVTAVAALRLVEAGRLNLDDPVSRWLPELAAPRVVRTPRSDLDDTVALARPIAVRDLLAHTAGHGIAEGTPYHDGQVAAGVAAGPEPVDMDADAWLERLADLPLFHQPGEGWLYHHGAMLAGILIGRLTGRSFGDHLTDDVFAPLGMVDSGFWAHDPTRLPAAYRIEDDGPVEIEPAGAGYYASDPGFLVDHGELVSTASDYLRFARMLRDGGLSDEVRYLSQASVAALTSDQVPEVAKTGDSFGPDIWKGGSWGFGVYVEDAGRYGWSGGLGTDFAVDPTSGRITILLTQAEMGPATWGAITGFREVGAG